jgi:hypothetical protein
MKYYCKFYIIQAPSEEPASAGFFILTQMVLSSSISLKTVTLL